jgi:hypothetical protein
MPSVSTANSGGLADRRRADPRSKALLRNFGAPRPQLSLRAQRRNLDVRDLAATKIATAPAGASR